MNPLVAVLLNHLIEAWGLPIALGIARAWLHLYTRFVPQELRERRREEMESDYFEQTEADRAVGYRPGAIGLRIVWRSVSGVYDDITWAGARIVVLEDWSPLDKFQAGLQSFCMAANGASLAWAMVDPSRDPSSQILRIVLGCFGIAFSLSFLLYVRRRVRGKRTLAALRVLNDDLAELAKVDILEPSTYPMLMGRLEAAAVDTAIPLDTRTRSTDLLDTRARVEQQIREQASRPDLELA